MVKPTIPRSSHVIPGNQRVQGLVFSCVDEERNELYKTIIHPDGSILYSQVCTLAVLDLARKKMEGNLPPDFSCEDIRYIQVSWGENPKKHTMNFTKNQIKNEIATLKEKLSSLRAIWHFAAPSEIENRYKLLFALKNLYSGKRLSFTKRDETRNLLDPISPFFAPSNVPTIPELHF